VEEMKEKLNETLKDKKINFNITKKIKTTTKSPYESPCSTYTFKNINDNDNVNVEIECSPDLSQILQLLQPYISEFKETISCIKKYRMFGVPTNEKTYKINGEWTPYEHQWQMFKIGMRLKSFANLSQMGTGKTPATIMIIDQRLINKEIERGHILYIAPAATLLGLQAHFKKYAPHLSTIIVDGSYHERFEKVLDKNVDVKLINYEAFTMKTTLLNDKKEEVALKFSDIVGCNRWDFVIIDEAHKIKNPEAQRTKNIIDTFRDVKYKCIMTGTITANKLYDIHCPFIFLNNAINFNSVLTSRSGEKLLTYGELNGDFLRTYFNKQGWGFEAKSGTIGELREKLEECSIRFEKKECMNLPDKIYEVRLVELSAKQQKLYNDLETFLHAEIEGMLERGVRISVTHILALNMKLAEAANGWIYDPYGNAIEFPENPKVDAVLDTLDDIDDGECKTLIFSQFKQDMRMLKKAIEKEYGYGSVAIIDGSVDFSLRHDISKRFNDKTDKLRFVVANVIAAGTGIDLIGASYEIYFSNSFRKVERSQSEDRAHRPGMQDKLTIIDIVAKNTIDEKVIDALKTNKSMSSALVENLGFDPKLISENINVNEDPVIIEHQNSGVEFQKQHGSECILAAIAHAANVKINDVRERGYELENKRIWFPYKNETAIRLMREFIDENTADSYNTFLNSISFNDIDNVEAMIEKRKKYILNMDEINVPTTGRGLLYIAHDRDYHSNGWAHIVYYENGWIYDSSFDDKMENGKWISKIWDCKAKVIWRGGIE
jgi:SNF2 family DNA or RNA helicase